MLDELEAYGLFDKLGVPHAPSIALDTGIAKAPALPFAYPVVVKALSAAIAHKSDVGGVVLNVRDDAALLAAIAKIKQATKVDRVLVQPMISGLGEVLIGYRVDPDVGPTGDARGRRRARRNPTATAASVSRRSILPRPRR